MGIIKDECGAFPAFLTWLASIVLISLVWIVCNEFVLVGFNLFPASHYGWTIGLLWYIWRLGPFMLLLFGGVWVILKAHRSPGATYIERA